MKPYLNQNPYKCAECGYDKSINANSLVRHVISKHSDLYPLFKDYFDKFIAQDQSLFELLAAARILVSPVPLQARLTASCYECGLSGSCSFESIGKGYAAFCSLPCASANKEVSRSKHDRSLESLKKRYGTDSITNVSQIEGVSKKVKRTKKQRYGDENYNNLKKQKTTVQTRYGVDYFTQTSEYNEKVKKTSLENYGVEHHTKSQTVKNKIIATNQRRYGHGSVLSVPRFRENITKTNMSKYGVSSVLKLQEVRSLGLEKKRKNFELKLKEFDFQNVQLIDAESNLFKCNVCNSTFAQSDITLSQEHPSRFPRCKKCFPVIGNSDSVFHQEVVGFLSKNISTKHGEIIQNSRKILPSGKEIDIWFPSLNIGIELNGLWWHSEGSGRKPRGYHYKKTIEAESVGVQLIHLYSDDWNDPRQKNIIKRKLLHVLGVNEGVKSIGARKLNISCIDTRDKKTFSNHEKDLVVQVQNLYEKNHIQGSYERASIHVVGMYEQKVVAAMSFATLGSCVSTVELERFCIDSESYKIPGAASKLLKSFQKNAPNVVPNCIEIISFADRSWTTTANNTYKKIGFVEAGTTQPRYWYLDTKTGCTKRLHRFSFRRKHLPKKLGDSFNEELSEFENMKLSGYDRIWDSGLIRYILNMK